MSPQEQLVKKVRDCVDIGNKLYGMILRYPQISFDLKGRAAGQAILRKGGLFIRFNRDMLAREAFKHQLNNTAPHEVAHLFCFMNPMLGNNHDSGWERVCLALGGSGATRHKEDIVLGKGTTYEYISDRGEKVRFGDRHHRYLQSGGVLKLRRGRGSISSSSAYSIVGRSGRTLDNAIVVQGVPTKEVPVRQLMPTLPAFTPAAAPTAHAVPPVVRVVNRVKPALLVEPSKLADIRRIMFVGYRAGKTYGAIVEALISTVGLNEELAHDVFKANAAKMAIPASFCK